MSGPGRGRHPHRQRSRHRPVSLARLRDQLRLSGRRPHRGDPAGLAATAGPGRRPGPRRAQDPPLQDLARRRSAGTQRATAPAESLPGLAVDHRCSHRLDPHQRPATGPMNSAKPSRDHGRNNRGDPWNPRPPGPPAGPLPYPNPEINLFNEAQHPFNTTSATSSTSSASAPAPNSRRASGTQPPSP